MSITVIKLRKNIFKNKNMRSLNLSFRPARELEKYKSSKPQSLAFLCKPLAIGVPLTIVSDSGLRVQYSSN